MAACTCSRRSITTCNSQTMLKKTHSGAEPREDTMETFVATKLNEFETGKITRRKLIEALTLAATAGGAAGSAAAQTPDPALKAQLINHFSYTCPNFREAADW